MPREVMSGIIPATKASVVIRMGRSRSRFASRMASSRGIPSARRWFVWSTWRIAFFFTTPKSTMMPSIDRSESSWWKRRSDSSANGTVSGKRQHDRDRVEPRAELRREDEVHEDERQADRDANPFTARPVSFVPRGDRVVLGGHVLVAMILTSASETSLCPTPGATFDVIVT
jgi:hypothetical protein